MSGCTFLDKVTVDSVLAMYRDNDYKIFDKGDYNLNIFGIRATCNMSNSFNDAIGVLYKVNGIWQLFKCNATTDPGLYYRENPCNVKGTAVLATGYHKSAFKVGRHQGKYEALVQNVPLPLHRDFNKDNVVDTDSQPLKEFAGINLHKAGRNSVQVDKWSAGCQVIASQKDWDEFMSLVHESSRRYGSKFSYALFTEDMLTR